MEKAEPIVRIISTHPETQGEFVELPASQFDPARHVLFDAVAPASPPKPRGRPRKISE